MRTKTSIVNTNELMARVLKSYGYFFTIAIIIENII